MVGKLGFDDRLEQDDFEGVDEDEWVSITSILPFFFFFYQKSLITSKVTLNSEKHALCQQQAKYRPPVMAPRHYGVNSKAINIVFPIVPNVTRFWFCH